MNKDPDSLEPQQIFVDNQGAIQLAKNPKFHERTKHIEVRYHFVRDACERNIIRTTYLPTSEMTADILTKIPPREAHWKHDQGLGLVRRAQASGEAAPAAKQRIVEVEGNLKPVPVPEKQ